MWSDPAMMELRSWRLRLWCLLCDMERVRSQWNAEDVATWTLERWAAALHIQPYRFKKDVETLRAKGFLCKDDFTLLLTRELEAAHRPRYPSDDRSPRNGVYSRLRTDSAGGSVGVAEGDSDPAPTHARAPDPEPESGPAPESGTGSFLYKNRNPDSGPEPEPARLQAAPIPPPKSTVERLVEIGMAKKKAEERVKEFGEERVAEVIDAIAYAPKPVNNQAGWVMDHLLHPDHPLPPGYLAAKQKEALIKHPPLVIGAESGRQRPAHEWFTALKSKPATPAPPGSPAETG